MMVPLFKFSLVVNWNGVGEEENELTGAIYQVFDSFKDWNQMVFLEATHALEKDDKRPKVLITNGG